MNVPIICALGVMVIILYYAWMWHEGVVYLLLRDLYGIFVPLSARAILLGNVLLWIISHRVTIYIKYLQRNDLK